MKTESCQFTARCQFPFRDLEFGLEQMLEQMLRAFLKRRISAESLFPKWHPSAPLGHRLAAVDLHRLQLPLRLCHHKAYVLNMFHPFLMSKHAKAPTNSGLLLTLDGQLFIERTIARLWVLNQNIRFEVAQWAISPLASSAREKSALARRSRPRTTKQV